MTDLLKQPEPMPYLSVVIGRTPKQKLHKRISDAKNAFSTSRYNPDTQNHSWRRGTTHAWGQIYEWVDGQWVLLYDVPQPTEDHGYDVERTWGTYREYESRPWKLDG